MFEAVCLGGRIRDGLFRRSQWSRNGNGNINDDHDSDDLTDNYNWDNLNEQ